MMAVENYNRTFCVAFINTIQSYAILATLSGPAILRLTDRPPTLPT
jgi:hypothetical protein